MAKKKSDKPKEPSLSKYYTAQNVELLRSQIHFADYNPRTIGPENLKTLKKGIKKFGLVGGIVVNKQTGNTLVQGHQRLTVMDDLQKYNAETHENDYIVRADIIDIDEKSEKELVILLNNPNAQGEWDYDQLKIIVPQIDYSAAGLTEADLSMIGIGLEQEVAAVTQSLVSSQQVPLGNSFADFDGFDDDGDGIMDNDEPDADGEIPLEGEGVEADPDAVEKERHAKIQHMKDVKAQATQQAMERAEQAMAYLMLSFDNMDNMQDFLAVFDMPPQTQIIKGEDLLAMLAN